MQKRSHVQLAQALLQGGDGFSARRYEWAFLFGSFQPDCNPFSYLKGSLRGKKFGGHTYGNCRPFLDARILRLQNRDHWTLWQYYTLGKLTHYVADTFTYPHNPHFPGRGWDHHRYETELRARLTEILENRTVAPGTGVQDLPAELERLHTRYLEETDPGVDRDIQYILEATALLMACCAPAPEAFLAPERVPEPFAEPEGVGEFA